MATDDHHGSTAGNTSQNRHAARDYNLRLAAHQKGHHDGPATGEGYWTHLKAFLGKIANTARNGGRQSGIPTRRNQRDG
jgi:hypothetical protein